jgi:biopolymer transport protein ExbD
MKLFSTFIPAVFFFLFALTGCEREQIEELLPDDPVVPEITITIESEDSILINGESVPYEELAEYLEERVRDEEMYAQIHAAPDVSPEFIREVEEVVHSVEGVEIYTAMPEVERM